jgi:hypothetical protein
MATKRPTAEDYRKKYEEAWENIRVIEIGIALRITTLAKQHPNMVVDRDWLGTGDVITAKQFIELGAHKTGYRSDVQYTIEAIKTIEAKLAKKERYKQTEIKFD